MRRIALVILVAAIVVVIIFMLGKIALLGLRLGASRI